MRLALTAVAALVLLGTAATTARSYTVPDNTPDRLFAISDPIPRAETLSAERARLHRERLAVVRRRLKPFVYPDGKRWAVPYPIAWCESGGNYFVGPSGAYGLIPPFPQYMSPREQDRTALRLYREMGESPWAPYEGGCAYR